MADTLVVQVHLTTPQKDGLRNWVTWIEAELKPRKGMVLFLGKDVTPWTVEAAYIATPTKMSDINSGWKVGGL